MAKVADGKTQVLLILDEEDKEELKRIASSENRSFNNLINTIVKTYLKEHTEKK